MPLATGQPVRLIEALGRRDDWFDLRIYSGLLVVPPDVFQKENVHYLSGFFGPISPAVLGAPRAASQRENAHSLSGFFGPSDPALRDMGANISSAPSASRGSERLRDAPAPRVMATAAAPPDSSGNVSLSLHAG